MSAAFDPEGIACRLAADQPVRRGLPGWGRLHVDRRLPFLCVYRKPEGRQDAGTDRLVVGEAAYLKASAGWPGLSELIAAVTDACAPAFGAFQLIEVWSGEPTGDEDAPPGFRVLTPHPEAPAAEALAACLRGQKLLDRYPEVESVHAPLVAPPGLEPLGPDVLGLEVGPIHHGPRGQLLPAISRALHRVVARALKQACFVFAKEQTSQRPLHWHAMGRRAVTRAVWVADRRMAEVAAELDFMLMVTPVDAHRAWKAFRRSGHGRAPVFRYRAWPGDPSDLLSRLHGVPVARIEDPTLRDLFEEKRIHLGRKVAMLRDRGTADFLYGSLQVYGGVDDALLRQALDLLERLPPGGGEQATGVLRPAEFAELAREELAAYRAVYPDFSARVRLRADVPGVATSRGNLLVGENAVIPRRRARALLAHEVGTHLVCHYNARAQPFRLMRLGLPGHEELQEGLAMVAEYLVGGLDLPRMRLLAGRVLAARRAVEGRDFLELFHELKDVHHFGARTAFMLTMRVLRGGGFTKDACYLRGLARLLELLSAGVAFDKLLVGRISADSLAVVEELQGRDVLKEGVVRPRFLDDGDVPRRLDRLAAGMTLESLVEDVA